MSTRFLFLLALTALLLFSTISRSHSIDGEDDDEDLSFLEDSDVQTTTTTASATNLEAADVEDDDDFSGEDDDDFSGDDDFSDPDEYKEPEIDEQDVVVLKERNFTSFIEDNQFVMVEFYAPWCGHCQALAPEYAAAATELKDEKEVTLAKIDATEETELAHEYNVQGFPTVLFFVDGEPRPYNGQRTKEGIVTWIKKKIGPGIYNLSTIDDAERVLTSENKVVLGYLNSLVGSESEELAAASRLEDDVNFYQTVNADVATLFHLDPEVKRPALVILKKEAEKITQFDGEFVKSSIAEFVLSNKLPLVIDFSREMAPLIFESPIKKQVLLFATVNDSATALPVFQEAAKLFKGKLIFVYVDLDNENDGRPVADYFGVTGDAPKVVGFTGPDDSKKFFLDGELTFEKIKSFGEDFFDDKLKPFYKSDPIPETNDGDVKIVVGNNFDDIVLDESKDVLLEIYAPWCGHCEALEPTYNKLAKHLGDIDSLVIAKMDGTTNEHPRAKADGFPTILFFPAGNKSFDPITVDTDRTVVAFYKFLKKHASVPFKIQKPASTSKPDTADVNESQPSSIKDVKDEL
ncbi:hypothetical protein ACFE04_014822 [Oxalis oulophora]